MRSLITIVIMLTACGTSPDDSADTDIHDTDTDTVVDTDVDTDSDTHDVEPAIDLAGRWMIPYGTTLPGQADGLWCTTAEIGDYEDETWLETGDDVECYEGTPSGCAQDLEFSGRDVVRHVRYAADGPCPYDGVTRSVIAWEDYGSWSLISTDGTTDVYDVDGVQWSARHLGDGRTIVITSADGDVTLTRGTGPWFEL